MHRVHPLITSKLDHLNCSTRPMTGYDHQASIEAATVGRTCETSATMMMLRAPSSVNQCEWVCPVTRLSPSFRLSISSISFNKYQSSYRPASPTMSSRNDDRKQGWNVEEVRWVVKWLSTTTSQSGMTSLTRPRRQSVSTGRQRYFDRDMISSMLVRVEENGAGAFWAPITGSIHCISRSHNPTWITSSWVSLGKCPKFG
jgi:hypothetical protein